ncbi:malate dehydrogenase [Xylaria digitata]|nr:malate dehydrogenase [Xylaria digitata]
MGHQYNTFILINITITKLALLGAAGQIGTPLSLLAKSSDLFDEISPHDLVHTPGIATDLNHIGTRAKVSGFLAKDGGLTKALEGADIVVVTAGIARKPGMTRDGIIYDIFTEVAKTSPNAVSCVVTNPVNSTAPVAAKALRKGGAFDPTHLFGVTSLDVVRASTFISHALGGNPDPGSFKVPVIGGHSGTTILPLYKTGTGVQFGGDEIAESKQGAGSATTCMAYAGFRFVKALLSAQAGQTVTEEAYVYLPGIPGGKDIAERLGVDYFAVKILLGASGAAKVLDFGELSENEQKLLEVALKDLKVNIQDGQAFEASKEMR